MMPLQRAWGAESRVRNKLSNGPLRAQSNGADLLQSILRREGIRQLPGICWYPVKRIGSPMNQGGTADKMVLFALDRTSFCQGRFFVPLAENTEKRSDGNEQNYFDGGQTHWPAAFGSLCRFSAPAGDPSGFRGV